MIASDFRFPRETGTSPGVRAQSPFVVRVWHGFESTQGRALILDAISALRETPDVVFRPATQGEHGIPEEDVSHAHCIGLDAAVPVEAVLAQVLAIACDGRPLILVGHQDHPVARLAREHGCAVLVPRDSAAALAEAVRALVEDPLRADLMGLRARSIRREIVVPGPAG